MAYSLLENYEARSDKTMMCEGELYQDLGVVHFVTKPKYRNKGYATLLADLMYENVIKPLLDRHKNVNVYVTATGKAVPLMQRTGINAVNLVTQFYSDISFKEKVVKHINLSKSRK